MNYLQQGKINAKMLMTGGTANEEALFNTLEPALAAGGPAATYLNNPNNPN